jgi:protease-4
MDFEQDNGISGAAGGQLPQQQFYSTAPPTRDKKKSGWRIFWGIFLALSVLANIVLFLMVVGIFAVLVSGQADIITEKVLIDGPRTNKIAVVNLYGLIDSETARDVTEQLQHAGRDDNVKAVILRVDSPGGTISGSDQIHNEILKLRDQTNKPVVAFMRNIAASGGYYCSVATEKIVAEPTTITGSVGVIMGYLVLEELLEGKLGIHPVIVKSGEKKDWPSSFHQPTQEQLDYLEQKVIDPAYNRFVNIVADGRAMLSLDDVKQLSDGSIYPAQEALDEQLIDSIGYFDDAVEQAKDLAGIKKAHVVEYERPFSFAGFFGSSAKNILKIDRNALFELSTPQVMYLWSIY